MEKFKFEVGDVLDRPSEPVNKKYVILQIFEEKLPFGKRLWYRGIEMRNFQAKEPFDCLQSIMEESFVKVNEIDKTICEKLASLIFPKVC